MKYGLHIMFNKNCTSRRFDKSLKACIKGNLIYKRVLLIILACLVAISFIIAGVVLFPQSQSSLNEPSGALSSSTAYYKNGSNCYTLSSSVQHYKCTNSRHSGSNDYTTSSVSGTCYTSTGTSYYSHSVSKQYGSHSCSAQYGSHNVKTSHTYGQHHAGGKQYLD